MGRFADPYGDDRLPEGMTCTGYDADTGRKYYVDHTSGGSYVGAPYAEYGVLTPLRSATTARQDNARNGRRLFDEGTDPIPRRRRPARANTAPFSHSHSTWISVEDCPRIIPRRPQKAGEEEVHPKYQDGSDGPMVTSDRIPKIDRSKTRRAKSVGTWSLLEWISSTAANQYPAEDEEEAGAADPGTASESPTDWVQIPQSSSPDTDFDPYQQAVDNVGDPAFSTPRDEVSSSGKKRRRTILRRLLRDKQ